MNDFHKLIELCQNRNMYIQTHNFPDPDALGSAFGLQRLLAYFGVESKICCAGNCDKLSVSKMLDYFDIHLTSCTDVYKDGEKVTESRYSNAEHRGKTSECGCSNAEHRKETSECGCSDTEHRKETSECGCSGTANTEKETPCELCTQMQTDDAIICVDSQKNGGNVAAFAGNIIACIDHHPTFTQESYEYAEICITGSCATLIAKYYQELGITPEQDVATALLYGLRMDTLQFTRGVTPLDIEMFGFLFPLCDENTLFQLEHNNMCLNDLRAYGAVIDSISIYGEIGFAEIPFACPDGLVATMSDFILDLEEVSISIVCCRRTDGMKLSVRSERPDVHAGWLIHSALKGIGDGGGHHQMAGGLVKWEMLKQEGCTEQMIRERFLEVLQRESSLR